MGLRHPVPWAHLVILFPQIRHYLHGSFAEHNALTYRAHLVIQNSQKSASWSVCLVNLVASWVFENIYLGRIPRFHFKKKNQAKFAISVLILSSCTSLSTKCT